MQPLHLGENPELSEQDETDTTPQSGEPSSDAQPTEMAEGALSDIPQEPTPQDHPGPASDSPDFARPAEEELSGETAEPTPPEESQPEEPAEPPPPQPPRLSRADRDTYNRQRRRFAACGRCGYFIADCQLYVGEPALQSAILTTSDDWLRLEGDASFRKLVMEAYGVKLDMAFDLFDGLCPECRRRFVLANDENGSSRLKIQL